MPYIGSAMGAVGLAVVGYLHGKERGPERIVEKEKPLRCPNPDCGLLIIGDRELDLYTHVLCITKAEEMLAERKAREEAQELANKQQQEKWEADRKLAELEAEEAEKKFTVEIKMEVNQGSKPQWEATTWRKDKETDYWVRYHWSVVKGQRNIGNGYSHFQSVAEEEAKQVIELYKREHKTFEVAE